MKRKFRHNTILAKLLCAMLVISMLPCFAAKAEAAEAEAATVGDVDGDGSITPKDVTKLRRYLAGGWGVDVATEDGDVDEDGAITPKDVTKLRRYLAGGWGVTLPQKAAKELAPVAVSESSLDSICILFNMPVSEVNNNDVTVYYMNGEEKISLNVTEVKTAEKELNVKLESKMPQDETIYVDYNGKLAGSFKSVLVTADSVVAVVVESKKIETNVPSEITFTLLDKNGVDITSASNEGLNGFIISEIKEQARYPFTVMDGQFITITEDDSACPVQVEYVWYDSNGIQNEVIGEAVYSTGDGVLFPSESSYNQVEYPVEPVPVRMDVYTYRNPSNPGIINQTINAAFAGDYLNVLVKVLDQYGNDMDGISVNVERLSTSVAEYTGTSTLTSGEEYVLKASDVSGAGTLKLKLTCADGTGELTKVVYLSVGNDDQTAIYVPVISRNILDTAITNDSTQESIKISLEGKTSGGYRMQGAPFRFVGATPKAGEPFADSLYFDGEYVFTVLKDGKIQAGSDLSTFNGFDTFANVVNLNDNTIKMNSGVYILQFYQILNVNGKVNPKTIGRLSFSVVDSQPLLVLTPSEHINKINDFVSDEIQQAFDATFDGVKVNSSDLLFDYTINGTNDAAYIKSVNYTIKNNNGLGNWSIKTPVDKVVKKANAKPELEVVTPAGTLTDWERGEFSYIVTDMDADDYVVDNKINTGCKEIGALSMDYQISSVLQIAVPYTKNGQTVVETAGTTSVSGYKNYLFKSEDESVLMIGQTMSENKTRLIFNNMGNTTIKVYGIRPDGKAEFISDIEVEIVAARKATTFNVTGNKKLLNMAYEADGIQYSFSVEDQYGNKMNGLLVYVSVMINGQANFIALENSSNSFYLNPFILEPYYTSQGNQNLLLSFEIVNSQLKKQEMITLGNEPIAQRYLPVLSGNSLSIADTSLYNQKAITVALKGSAKGFDTEGTPVEFSETPVKEIEPGNEVKYVYNVEKDGEILKASDLPTMVMNVFYNCILNQDDELITMSPGEYTLKFYKITGGDKAKIEMLGVGAFTVTE